MMVILLSEARHLWIIVTFFPEVYVYVCVPDILIDVYE
jgi:hypothetical protein